MNKFFEELLPNSIYFYNKLLMKDYKEASELTSKDLSTLSFELKKLGMFLVKYIEKKNYVFETLEYTKYYRICDQYNKNKDTFMKVFVMTKILMIDYDNKSYNEIENILKNTGETYIIYETFKGFHVFCVSKEYSFKNYKTLQLMYDLGCDPLYISYTYNFGWCVRLTKKENRDEPFVESYNGIIGDEQKIIPELMDIIKIKDEYIKNYFNTV